MASSHYFAAVVEQHLVEFEIHSVLHFSLVYLLASSSLVMLVAAHLLAAAIA